MPSTRARAKGKGKNKSKDRSKDQCHRCCTNLSFYIRFSFIIQLVGLDDMIFELNIMLEKDILTVKCKAHECIYTYWYLLPCEQVSYQMVIVPYVWIWWMIDKYMILIMRGSKSEMLSPNTKIVTACMIWHCYKTMKTVDHMVWFGLA